MKLYKQVLIPLSAFVAFALVIPRTDKRLVKFEKTLALMFVADGKEEPEKYVSFPNILQLHTCNE